MTMMPMKIFQPNKSFSVNPRRSHYEKRGGVITGYAAGIGILGHPVKVK